MVIWGDTSAPLYPAEEETQSSFLHYQPSPLIISLLNMCIYSPPLTFHFIFLPSTEHHPPPAPSPHCCCCCRSWLCPLCSEHLSRWQVTVGKVIRQDGCVWRWMGGRLFWWLEGPAAKTPAWLISSSLSLISSALNTEGESCRGDITTCVTAFLKSNKSQFVLSSCPLILAEVAAGELSQSNCFSPRSRPPASPEGFGRILQARWDM